MSLTTEKANRLGELLAKSPINEDLKELILNKLSDMSESAIDLLIASLENENLMTENLIADLDKFDQEQIADWNNLEQEQSDQAMKLVDEEISKIEGELINDLKSDLTKDQ